ncbi:MAG: hypothetical protein RSD57_09900 [Comamonas sp.]
MLNQWTMRVPQSQANNLSTDIKGVGTAIRDWITPFYTLGGVTTFVITVLTLIDRSGWLVRAITVALILLTIVVCAHAWVKSRNASAASTETAKSTSPKLHTALIIVSLFFCVGLLVSEALMHEKRPSAATTEAPRLDSMPSSAEPVAKPPATTYTAAPAPPASPVVAPAAVETPAFAVTPVPAALSTTQAESELKKKQPVSPANQPPAAIKEATPKKTNKPASPNNDSAPIHAFEPARPKPAKAPSAAALPARCSEIMAQFSAGRSVNEGDKQYLENSCR